ncbi:MAG: type 4 prepilin-like proteins leader peptide-processing enzyme [Planctomycetota bacterium]|nr:MAG: type 4 prepilin-like proteins leader peptide-processing enzyme [Planctomycetota bacterium]
MLDSIPLWFAPLAVACFGLAVGSFCNVAIHRVPREGLSVRSPSRSHCPSCGTQLLWSDNLPVLSWLLLRARCRHCKQPVSWRYPAVELLVAGLMLALWSVQQPASTEAWLVFGVGAVFAATCVVVSAIDLEFWILPDVVTLPGTAIGVVLSAALPALHAAHPGFRLDNPHGSATVLALTGALAGGGSLWLVGQLGNLALRKKIEEAGVSDAMGLGDVKWMALCGTLLGPLLVLEAILAACFLGALVGIALKLIHRIRGGRGPVGLPFGPFLSVGALVELAWPGSVWGLMNTLLGGAA